jgi:hypothetical protein
MKKRLLGVLIALAVCFSYSLTPLYSMASTGTMDRDVKYLREQARSNREYYKILDALKLLSGDDTLPEEYGGAYIDTSSGKLVVKVVDSDQDFIEWIYSIVDYPSQVVCENCKFSKAELLK